MFMIQVDYPDEDEELQIVRQTTQRQHIDIEHALDAEQVMQIQDLVRDVPVADHVIRYALQLVRATRRPTRGGPDARPQFVRKYLNWGAGPRASQYLVLAGKARAVLDGRTHVTIEDIREVAHPVLRHRLITSFNAEADGLRSDDLIDRLLEEVPTDGESASNENQMDAVMR